MDTRPWLVGKAPGSSLALKQQTDPTQDQVPGCAHFWIQPFPGGEILKKKSFSPPHPPGICPRSRTNPWARALLTAGASAQARTQSRRLRPAPTH